MRYSTCCLSSWPMMLRYKQENVVSKVFAWRKDVVGQFGGEESKELDEAILNIQKSRRTDENWLRCGSQVSGYLGEVRCVLRGIRSVWRPRMTNRRPQIERAQRDDSK